MTSIDFSPRIPVQLAGARIGRVKPGTKIQDTRWGAIAEGGETLEPDERIAVYADGERVYVDEDSYKGESWLAAELEWPETFTVRTPSGGRHRYYKQNPACPLTDKTFHNADIKATRKSYVCFGSGYTVEDDAPVAEMPLENARAIRARPAEIFRRRNSSGGSSDPGCGHHAQALQITLNWARQGMPREQARELWGESEPGQHGCEDFAVVFDGAISWLADKAAGKSTLNTIESDRGTPVVLDVKNSASAYDPSWMPPVLDPCQANVKYYDEMDTHWLSRDWRTASSNTRTFYQLFAERYGSSKDGIDMDAPWLDGHDPEGAARAWLSSQKHPLIAQYHSKLVMLADAQPKSAKANPDDERPGENWKTVDLCRHIKRILIAAGEEGKRISDSGVKTIMNTDKYRKDHGVERKRSVRRLTVLRVRKLLEESGEIHQVKKEERFRSNHHWCNLPAMWAEGPSSPRVPVRYTPEDQTARSRVRRENAEDIARTREIEETIAVTIQDNWYKEACLA